MQANWSLILNVVLLAGVMYAIFHVLQMRKKAVSLSERAPSIGQIDMQTQYEDIISIRRVEVDPSNDRPSVELPDDRPPFELEESTIPCMEEAILYSEPEENVQMVSVESVGEPLMMFLLAKAERQLAGYELLQAVLAVGFRFGDGNLFHRHQYSNGQGTVMCSLAAATDDGVFDLQNIGAFMVRGLCIYMHASGNPGIDEERFDIMLDSAKTLSDDLDTYLLDDRKQTLSEASIARYHQQLNLA